MSIFLFVLGLVLGFGLKIGFDQYHYFRLNQEATTKELNNILVNFKALEKNKDVSLK